MKFLKSIALITWFVFFNHATAGVLVFEKTTIDVLAEPDQDLVVVEFAFKSEGDDAAVIKRHEAHCSCLEAQISDGGRLTWASGEEGTIRGLFEVGNFRGTIAKEISLLMADGKRHVLTVRLTMPELVKIEPKTLKWNEGSANERKAFKITINEDFPTNIIGVTSTNENKFPYELETIEEGKNYKLWVTPSETKVRGFGLLRLVTDSEFKKHKNYQAYVHISKATVQSAND